MLKASCPGGSSALVDAAREGLPLSRVPVGAPREVVSVAGPARAELEREGLLTGSVVTVVARTPLGGPVVVELGRARLALSVDVAAQVSTATPAALAGRR